MQSLEEMIRECIGCRLNLASRPSSRVRILSWQGGWNTAPDVLSRCNIGADGRTPYQRFKGRKFVGHMLEFGSLVMFRVSGQVHGRVVQERWFPGIWLGALGDEGGWAGGEVEGSEVKQPALCRGRL